MFFILVVFTINSCSERKQLPSPEFILAFNSSIGNYFEKSIIQLDNNNYKLKPSFATNSLISADSIKIIFKSALIDITENVAVDLSLSKVFHKSQFDSTSNGWVLKNYSDFSSLFSIGSKLNDDVSFNLYKNGKNYSFIPLITGSTNSEFVVENVYNNIDWATLANKGFLPSGSYGKIIVKFNFNTKLYNAQTNDTITLTNGQFQGLFVDR
jgi:hypothetical protein